MRKEYKEELENLTIKMEEAEVFAKKLPIFEQQIIEQKHTGNERHIRFGERYKNIPISWGINRNLYKSDTDVTIINYRGKSYTEFLFRIYINPLALFDCHYLGNLNEVVKTVPTFFCDNGNQYIYATDEQITELLEALNDWYLVTAKEAQQIEVNKKIEKAEKELEELKRIEAQK